MIFSYVILVLCLWLSTAESKYCYWNNFCHHQFFGTKTPYDAVRGDIREYPISDKCEVAHVWALVRHGHRYAKETEAAGMSAVTQLRVDIMDSYHAGTSQLCAQDIEDLSSWRWVDNFQPSNLSVIGHAELVSLGKRLEFRYRQLLSNSTGDDVYVRATNRERTEASSRAFVKGLTATNALSATIDEPWEIDEVIMPYDKYDERLRESATMTRQLKSCDSSKEYMTMMRNVQYRLGIARRLSAEDVNNLYELCRSSRLWHFDSALRSPWCAVFDDQDLAVLEYREDVKRYYKNGYGVEESVCLGSLPLKDLYENIVAATQGRGKRLVAYFSHKTLMEMVVTALGLFQDNPALDGGHMKRDRLWRSSEISCSSSNLIAVLLRCNNFGIERYRVQIFLNEKPTALCPVEGCSWQKFIELFQRYASADLSLCKAPQNSFTDSSEIASKDLFIWLVLLFMVLSVWK